MTEELDRRDMVRLLAGGLLAGAANAEGGSLESTSSEVLCPRAIPPSEASTGAGWATASGPTSGKAARAGGCRMHRGSSRDGPTC